VSAELLAATERLARLRALETLRREQLKRAMDRFETEHATLLADAKSLNGEVHAAEEAVRAIAVQVFRATQDRHPAPGIGIRVTQHVEITDPGAAFSWAREKDMALKLDEAAIKKIATTGTTILGVQVTPTPEATIAKDLLSHYPAALAAEESHVESD
jgi:hypothetical protein